MSEVSSREDETGIKSLAKALSQQVSGPITERALRAQVRTACYNRVLDALRAIDARQAEQRARQRRVTLLLGGLCTLFAAAFAIGLIV